MIESRNQENRFTAIVWSLVLILAGCAHALAQSSHAGKRNKVQETNMRQLRYGDFGEVSVLTLAGKRDLSKYKQGGHYDFRSYLLGKKRGNNNRNELIKFIVDNWTSRQLAYVRYSVNSPDAGATYHLFIEPDKKGSWTVFCKMARWHSLITEERSLVTFPRAYSVEAGSDQHTLLFKNKQGQEIAQLEIDEN